MKNSNSLDDGVYEAGEWVAKHLDQRQKIKTSHLCNDKILCIDEISFNALKTEDP